MVAGSSNCQGPNSPRYDLTRRLCVFENGFKSHGIFGARVIQRELLHVVFLRLPPWIPRHDPQRCAVGDDRIGDKSRLFRLLRFRKSVASALSPWRDLNAQSLQSNPADMLCEHRNPVRLRRGSIDGEQRGSLLLATVKRDPVHGDANRRKQSDLNLFDVHFARFPHRVDDRRSRVSGKSGTCDPQPHHDHRDQHSCAGQPSVSNRHLPDICTRTANRKLSDSCRNRGRKPGSFFAWPATCTFPDMPGVALRPTPSRCRFE